MNESHRMQRSRGRNVVAVSLLWSGLAAFTAVGSPPTAAAAPASTAAGVAVDGSGHAASGVTAAAGAQARALALLTAEPAAVTGVAPDGTAFTGTFNLRRFQVRRGVLYAVGRLNGVLGTALVNQSIQLPVTGAVAGEPEVEGLRRQPVPTPGACDLLTLALGPLDLDLLGLRVALDEVNLLLEAIPGAGNLLGNLLCGVAGLLDGGLGGGLGGLLANLLGAIADLLNGLLGL